MCVCVFERVPYLDRRDMCVWCVAMYSLHGSKVLVTHVKHLGTFPWSQMCWTVLQGGRLLILVPVLLQTHTDTDTDTAVSPNFSCIRSSRKQRILIVSEVDNVKITIRITVSLIIVDFHWCFLSLKQNHVNNSPLQVHGAVFPSQINL